MAGAEPGQVGTYDRAVEMTVTGEVLLCGPSPYHFVAVSEPEAEEIREVARHVTYGWGMIPWRAVGGPGSPHRCTLRRTRDPVRMPGAQRGSNSATT